MNKFNLQLFASSSDYWQRREKEALKNRIEDEKEYQKRIEMIYERMIRESTNEINAFYARYASKEGISISEAKKRVSSVDIAEYEKKAKRYVEAAERDRQTKGKTDQNAFYFSDKANEEMRLYNATMKINRLEMLKANIGLELVKGHAELETFMNGILKGRTEDELKRQAGILGKTVLSNNKKADAIVNGSFYNASFSERIWSNQALLKADLSKTLQSGLIRGKGARELARDLESRFNVSKSNAERLMITELARVQTEAQKQSFIRNGFEEYMFITNSGCCDICAAISGKHFKVKDMMPGENAPPMHPFCRCSTAAYEDSKEYEEWLDFLDKGGTTEQYKEFKKTGVNPLKSRYNDSEKKEISGYLKQVMEVNKVKYNQVKKLKEKLEERKIIDRVGGGDKTKGSCASLALTYAGNKAGLDVLDFRGGKSQWVFSRNKTLREITKLENVKSMFEKGFNDVKNATTLLKKMDKDKEYILVTGRHAAVVKHNDDDYFYLELQSSKNNGYQKLTTDSLRKRFGCTRQMTVAGTKYKQESFLIDVKSLAECEELQDLLGYLNTSEEKQKKGSGGHEK